MRLTGRDIAHIACSLRAKAASDRKAAEAASETAPVVAMELICQAEREEELADAIECATALVVED